MASSGNEQQLRFRWNDHMQHISKVLTLQRFEEQFCDVTLVSDDGFVMKAHQAILASTSAYFQRVFSDITPDQHPMVVLRGANFREMTCLLDYMYQGSTQVHQSLMEAVLEVADMLEVKGLSQIRSNNSIKKFMAPPSSNSTTSSSTTTPSHNHPGDNNNVGHSRSSDEQSGPHTPEEQVYRDSQSRSSELETSWMRFSGNNMAETRSKESSRSHSEGSVTPSEEPPPSSRVRLLPCQETNSQETQEESQVSGMDLSMAKNEPWSPRESSPNGDKSSPSRKRRKLLEGICTEETSEPATDPDWGRVGSKVDERGLCQPRTISFTSITSEPGPSTEGCSSKETSAVGVGRYGCPQGISAREVSSDYETSSPFCMQQLSLPASKKHKETGLSNVQFMLNRSYICSCRGPCKVNIRNQSCTGTDKNMYQIERNVCKETLKLELPQTGNQSIESDCPSSNAFMSSYSTNLGSSLHIQESFGIESLCTLKDPHDNDQGITCTSLSQSFCNESAFVGGMQEADIDKSHLERCDLLPETKKSVYNSQSLCHSKIPDFGLRLEETCTDIDVNVDSSHDGSHVCITEEQQSFDTVSRKEITFSAAEFDHNASINAPSLLVSSQHLGKAGEYLTLKPVDAITEIVDRDPLEIAVPYAESSVASSSEGEDTKLTSLVSVTHKERLLVKYSVPEEAAGCPLEKRLVKPKSNVKRPLNPYLLFQNEMKKKVIDDYPGEHYQATLKRLGIMWKTLSPSEKLKWQTKAENLKKEHQRQNPNYHYNPFEAFKKRQQYLKARMERSRMYRVSSESSVEDNPAMMLSPKFYGAVKKDA
ncbi:uncharacterized protein LOC135206687 isoform X2 [Macrobrachium nipponense]|uniref:uncharacterized protein LOC135206687 isoform X2 n=1 Tax=Macrobrachium nipponense TaxID=159736 RepID=UPI0030C7E88B